jgi:hypothetical protein
LTDELYAGPGSFDASVFDVSAGDDVSVIDSGHPVLGDGSTDGGTRPVPDSGPVPVDDASAEEDSAADATGLPDAPAPQCDPTQCPTGCCYGDICALGNQSIACGTGGVACRDCTRVSGSVCVSGFCTGVLP